MKLAVPRAFGVAALAFCALALAQAAWFTLAGPGRKYFVDLPAAPTYSTVPMKTSAGEAYTMHQYLYEQTERAFVVDVATYPPGVNVSNPRASLEAGLANPAKGLQGGAWKEIAWTTQQGLLAVDAVGVNGDGSALRMYEVLNDRDMIVLIYAGPAGTGRAPDVDRFIASLRISR